MEVFAYGHHCIFLPQFSYIDAVDIADLLYEEYEIQVLYSFWGYGLYILFSRVLVRIGIDDTSIQEWDGRPLH